MSEAGRKNSGSPPFAPKFGDRVRLPDQGASLWTLGAQHDEPSLGCADAHETTITPASSRKASLYRLRRASVQEPTAGRLVIDLRRRSRNMLFLTNEQADCLAEALWNRNTKQEAAA